MEEVKEVAKVQRRRKDVTFLIHDETYGDTDKVLNFIQQFDAAFEGEPYTEDSKLRNVAMYLQNTARQWWASLRSQGLAPKTWSQMRVSIMKQFLPKQAQDNVLTTWRSLKLNEGESLQRYVEKFWDACLKAILFISR